MDAQVRLAGDSRKPVKQDLSKLNITKAPGLDTYTSKNVLIKTPVV